MRPKTYSGRIESTIRIEPDLHWLLRYVAMLKNASQNSIVVESLKEILPTQLEQLEEEISKENPDNFRISELPKIRSLLKNLGRMK